MSQHPLVDFIWIDPLLCFNKKNTFCRKYCQLIVSSYRSILKKLCNLYVKKKKKEKAQKTLSQRGTLSKKLLISFLYNLMPSSCSQITCTTSYTTLKLLHQRDRKTLNFFFFAVSVGHKRRIELYNQLAISFTNILRPNSSSCLYQVGRLTSQSCDQYIGHSAFKG